MLELAQENQRRPVSGDKGYVVREGATFALRLEGAFGPMINFIGAPDPPTEEESNSIMRGYSNFS